MHFGSFQFHVPGIFGEEIREDMIPEYAFYNYLVSEVTVPKTFTRSHPSKEKIPVCKSKYNISLDDEISFLVLPSIFCDVVRQNCALQEELKIF